MLDVPLEELAGGGAYVVRGMACVAEVASIVHGSTVVINALLERKGARTALVTTEGFRDVYEIGRINRPESFNLFFQSIDRSCHGISSLKFQSECWLMVRRSVHWTRPRHGESHYA